MRTHLQRRLASGRGPLLGAYLSIAFTLACPPAAAQEPQADVRPLPVGAETERQVTGQELHIYAAELKRGQVLRINVREGGADVVAVVMRVSDEQKASAVANFGSGFMRESLTVIPEQDGPYALLIRAQQVTDEGVEAGYKLSASLGAVGPGDVRRAQAERLLEEASQMLVSSDKSSALSAAAKYEACLTTWRALADRYWEGITEASLGNAYLKAEDFSRAEFHMGASLKIFEALNDVPALATAYGILGAFYIISKNEQKAREYIGKSAAISQRLGDGRAEKLLGAMHTLGSVGAEMTEEEESEDDRKNYLREISAARAKNDKAAEAAVWAKTTFRYGLDEDASDAMPWDEQNALYQRAEREGLPLARAGADRDVELRLLLGLALGFYDLTLSGDTDEDTELINRSKSMSYLRQALVLAWIQNNAVMEALAYYQLNLYYDGENDRLAIFFDKMALDQFHGLRRDFKVLDKESQQQLAKQMDELYGSLASDLFYDLRLQEAQQVLNMGRDQEFFDFKLVQSPERGGVTLTPREAENERTFASALKRIAAKYAVPRSAGYAAAGDELKDAFEAVERDFGGPASEKDVAKDVPDTADMQAALRELSTKSGRKHVAIYFVEDVGEILLITQDGIKPFATSTDIQDLKKYVNEGDMDEIILEFLKVLKSPTFDPRPLGAKIYDKIFKTKELRGDHMPFGRTLEAELAEVKPDVLLWSLSGNIRYVPVAALYDADHKQYLVEKYQNAVFTRARKERFLIEPRPWTSGAGFGTSVAYKDFPPLPGVVNEVAAIFGNPATGRMGILSGQIFLNQAFTRQALLTIQQRRPSLVHIASHFKFQPGDSRHSFLLLGDGDKFSLFDMQLNLTLFAGVDLLTLSACETAAQQSGAAGKEVDGFAELAQRLGASSVIATLWKVSDDGTSKLMTEFYRLRQGNPGALKSEILREAQLKFLNGASTAEVGRRRRVSRSTDLADADDTKSRIPFKPAADSPYEHPYYWAPFVLFGSSR
jgi:CHAT domain-containing protein/tetratricopeptide (TPR) repeat protein